MDTATTDPYFLALYSAALNNVGGKEDVLRRRGIFISEKLAATQAEDGSIPGAESSITNSRGKSLLLETTSICVINWLNQDQDAFAKEIELGIGFIISSVTKGGRFGQT